MFKTVEPYLSFLGSVISCSMAHNSSDKSLPNYDVKVENDEEKVKIICLGDSAVGKSK